MRLYQCKWLSQEVILAIPHNGLALIVFTLAHFMMGVVTGPHLSFLNAVAVSVQSLHGRLFSFQSGDSQTILNTIEAFVGLFIEAIVVAVITQRILGK